MKPAIKRKWVKALLSGKYQQGSGGLRNGMGAYCCLGVYGRVVLYMSDSRLYDRSFLRKPPYGWKDYAHIPGEIQRALADLNDEGVPFDMIAGLIDEAL